MLSVLRKLFGKRVSAGGSAGNAIENFKPELLIIGLGNPGGRYSGTRHNIGFDVIDGVCAGNGVEAPRKYYCSAECREAAFGVNNKPVLLVKPLTYMNLSGEAVGALADKYRLSPAECLVVVDDFNIPLGKIRIRKDGAHGGHNGLKSISAAIGSDYPRLRVGIGPLPAGVTITDFVLGHFDTNEREAVSKVINTAVEAVRYVIENDIDTAMNRYN